MHTALFWERIEGAEGEERVGFRNVAIAEVLSRLESGEAPADVASALELVPLDLVAVVGHDALGTAGKGLALTRARPSRPKLRSALSGIAGLLSDASTSQRLALEAGLLQIHDFWDESHTAAQEADDLGEKRVSAYWHAIAHRREPDPGNASYWFRRVGNHPVFTSLASAADKILKKSAAEPALIRKLLPSGDWDPFAFIEMTSRRQVSEATMREIQREEMRLLLAASIAS